MQKLLSAWKPHALFFMPPPPREFTRIHRDFTRNSQSLKIIYFIQIIVLSRSRKYVSIYIIIIYIIIYIFICIYMYIRFHVNSRFTLRWRARAYAY